MASQKTAVVTGVSTGIGRAVAHSLIGAGWRVYGSVRKATDAEAAAAALGAEFTPLIFDVTDGAGVKAAAAAVRDALGGRTLNALVNNAGVALAGPVRYLPLEDLQRQLDVNLFGAVRVTQAFLSVLGADRSFEGPPGRIVNISSVAGKIASPFMSPYAISKHALEALSDSLRRELIIHGIDVIIIGPGAIKTPIWAKADDLDIGQYSATEYGGLVQKLKDTMQAIGDQGLPPEDVGALVLKALTASKPKARYAILKNKLMMWTLPAMLPKRVVDGLMARRFGIAPRAKDKR